MTQPIKGRCLCGAIRIELTPPTQFNVHCHCESCRRAHAAPVVTWTGVNEDAFRVVQGENEIRRYESSPGTFRCFCATCGTSLLSYYTRENPDYGHEFNKVYVPVAVLLDPMDQPPQSHVSYEEHVDWCCFADPLPRFRGKSDEEV